ncbi:MAG: hypothetical protein R3B89_11120 [Polyangiaceae bacterium]
MVPRADVRSDPELAEASAEELRDDVAPPLRAAFDSEPAFPAARLVGEEPLEAEEIELTDVPAAVVEIPQLDDFDHGSGVVVIVPWERPLQSFWQRLWNTSKLTTQHGQTFFARFPDGDLVSAARFALTAEAIAVSGLCLVVGPVLWFAVPGLSQVAEQDPVLGGLLLRTIVAGVPTLAIAMAVLHGLYGLGLDLAARREGARGRLGHALRFGLYSAGWDLVTMPLGLIALALSDGVKSAGAVARNTWLLPRTCSQAFLCGIYGLSKECAQRAHRAAMLSTVAGLALGLVACIGLALLR